MLLGLLSNLGFYGLNGPSSDLIKNQIDEIFPSKLASKFYLYLDGFA